MGISTNLGGLGLLRHRSIHNVFPAVLFPLLIWPIESIRMQLWQVWMCCFPYQFPSCFQLFHSLESSVASISIFSVGIPYPPIVGSKNIFHPLVPYLNFPSILCNFLTCRPWHSCISFVCLSQWLNSLHISDTSHSVMILVDMVSHDIGPNQMFSTMVTRYLENPKVFNILDISDLNW